MLSFIDILISFSSSKLVELYPKLVTLYLYTKILQKSIAKVTHQPDTFRCINCDKIQYKDL